MDIEKIHNLFERLNNYLVVIKYNHETDTEFPIAEFNDNNVFQWASKSMIKNHVKWSLNPGEWERRLTFIEFVEYCKAYNGRVA